MKIVASARAFARNDPCPIRLAVNFIRAVFGRRPRAHQKFYCPDANTWTTRAIQYRQLNRTSHALELFPISGRVKLIASFNALRTKSSPLRFSPRERDIHFTGPCFDLRAIRENTFCEYANNYAVLARRAGLPPEMTVSKRRRVL